MQPLETVQQMYAAFSRGDIDFILGRIAPHCRWTMPGEGAPTAGVYTGPQGVAEFFSRLAQSEKMLRFEAKRFVADGDTVVAIGIEEMQATATGRTAATNWAMVFRLDNGKVAEFEAFFDTAAYVRAHTGAATA